MQDLIFHNGKDGVPVTNPIRYKIVRGAPFENVCCLLFIMPEFGVGDAAAHLDELNVMGLIGPRKGPEARWQH